jgi:PII-like signaling protein
MGFGQTSLLHTAKILRLSEDLPLIIEIVDSADKIKELLPALEEMIGSGSGVAPTGSFSWHPAPFLS